MPKIGLTRIICLLDRSGSMTRTRDDAIGGWNSFIEKQKEAAGTAEVSLVQFDHEYEPVYMAQPLADVRPLTRETYIPRGMTAYVDALGRIIAETGESLRNAQEEERPEKIVVVVITDGEENASKEFTLTEVKSRIQHQESVYKWQFVFLGANMDAVTESARLGVRAASALTYDQTAEGMKDAFAALGATVVRYRAGLDHNTRFLDEDRLKSQFSK